MLYKTTIIAALIAACGILTSTAITAEPRSTPKTDRLTNSVVLPTNSDGILSQCGDYFTFNPDKDHYGVVPDEYKEDFIPVNQTVIVPVYGYMVDREFNVAEATKLKQGENPYTVAEINRAMWDGNSIIWTQKTVKKEAYNFVKSYADTWNLTHEKKLIVLTWAGDISASKEGEKTVEKLLPQNREFAFSSWRISQSCMSFSEAAFGEFIKQADAHNAGRDIKPVPTATLVNGQLRR